MKIFYAISIFLFAANAYAEAPTYQECFRMAQDKLFDEQQRVADEAAAVQRGEVPVEMNRPKNPFDPEEATLVFNPTASVSESRHTLEFQNLNVKDYLPEKLDENSIEGQCQKLYGIN